MNYVNGYTNCNNILADLITNICFNGTDENSRWFLAYPRLDDKEAAYSEILSGKRATIQTYLKEVKTWKNKEIVLPSSYIIEGDLIYLPLQDTLYKNGRVELYDTNKKIHFYRTSEIEKLDTYVFYVDYERNALVVSESSFYEDEYHTFSIDYQRRSDAETEWYVSFDYSDVNKTFISYTFGKELDSNFKVINSKTEPVRTDCYFHTLDIAKYPIADWLPIEYFISWDMKSINFVFVEEPVFSGNQVNAWGYIGVLDEIKDSISSDFLSNFGAAGTVSFNMRNHKARNGLYTPRLVMYETKGGRPYPEYSLASYSEYEFAQKTGIEGSSAYTSKYSSSRLLATEDIGENERGYLRNIVVTPTTGKSHKDMFVKYKSDNEKESRHIYLSMGNEFENGAKTILGDSNNVTTGIAIPVSYEEEYYLGNVTFRVVDISTGEELVPNTVYVDVTSAQQYAEAVFVIDDVEYVLTNDKNFYKFISSYDGETAVYTFFYSSVFGDFLINFISSDSTPITLAPEVLVEKKYELTYTNPYSVLSYNNVNYLPTGKKTIYLRADEANDYVQYNFIFDRVSNTFIFNFIDSNGDAVAPAIVVNSGYCEQYIPLSIGPDENGYDLYLLETELDENPLKLTAVNGIDEQVFNFVYSLVTNDFLLRFHDMEGNMIMPNELYEDVNHLEMEKDFYLHDEELHDDDEYYYLNNAEDTNKVFIADNDIESQEYTYFYNRLVGDIIIGYEDVGGVAIRDTEYYEQVTSVNIDPPETIQVNSNFYYLLSENSEGYDRFIITPDDLEILHTYTYDDVVKKPLATFSVSTDSIYASGISFLVYRNDPFNVKTIVAVITQNTPTYSKTINGLTINASHSYVGSTLKFVLNLETTNFYNPIEETYTVIGYSTTGNFTVEAIGTISTYGYEVETPVRVERRVLNLYKSLTDWRDAPTLVEGTILPNTASSTYPSVKELLTIDLSKVVTEEVYDIIETYTT